MSIKEALLSYYIKDGIPNFLHSFDLLYNKKKTKKSQPQIEQSYNCYNFFNVKLPPYKRNLYNQQMIEYLQGRTKSDMLAQPKDNKIEDLQRFRVLYSKSLDRPTCIQEITKQQIQTAQRQCSYNHSLQLFQPFLQDDQLNSKMLQNSQLIMGTKQAIQADYSKLYENKHTTLLALKSKTETYYYHQQLREQSYVELQKPQSWSSYISSVNEQQFEEQQQKIIKAKQMRWFQQIMQGLNLINLIYDKVAQWDAKQLLKQRQAILNKLISGKHLLHVQQKMNMLKDEISAKTHDTVFFLRQKGQTHLQQTQKVQLNKNDNLFDKIILNQTISSNSQKISNPNHKYINPNIHNKAKISRQPVDETVDTRYQHMALKIQKLRDNKMKNHISDRNVNGFKQAKHVIRLTSEGQKRQFSPQINNFITNKKNIKYQPMNKPKKVQYIGQPVVKQTFQRQSSYNRHKPSPLRYQQLQSFAYQAQIQNFRTPNLQISQINSQNNDGRKQIPEIPQKQIKYPIKMQNFVLFSPTFSMLCYKASQIDLKQLTLRFMLDRMKYGINRVRIQYPSGYSLDVEAVVNKSMQILNCLGAEVNCQDEVDDAQIVVVSKLLKIQICQVIAYYKEYFSSNITKK